MPSPGECAQPFPGSAKECRENSLVAFQWGSILTRGKATVWPLVTVQHCIFQILYLLARPLHQGRMPKDTSLGQQEINLLLTFRALADSKSPDLRTSVTGEGNHALRCFLMAETCGVQGQPGAFYTHICGGKTRSLYQQTHTIYCALQHCVPH